MVGVTIVDVAILMVRTLVSSDIIVTLDICMLSEYMYMETIWKNLFGTVFTWSTSAFTQDLKTHHYFVRSEID